MKTFTTKPISLFLLLICICLSSCSEDSQIDDIVSQAQSMAEDNPDNALSLLNSIDNPESLEKDTYMRYILTLVQAKYKAKQDISSDSLIYEAQNYFNTQSNPQHKAQANLYAGIISHANQQYDKALSSFMKAEHYSEQIGDHVIAGRSQNNIGYIYYGQDIMDSAVIYYERALGNYDKQSGTELLKLQTLKNLGNSYALMNYPEKDEFYTQKGLAISKEIKDRNYEVTFMLNLGITYRDMGKYTKSAEYLYEALTKSTTPKDSIKIYLNLSKLYNQTNQTDSAKYYVTHIKSRVSKIKNNYLLKSIYGSLSDYYKQTGDYKQALQYSDLEKAANQRILKENEATKLYEANHKFYLENVNNNLKVVHYNT